jgi:hypothetical protein
LAQRIAPDANTVAQNTNKNTRANMVIHNSNTVTHWVVAPGAVAVPRATVKVAPTDVAVVVVKNSGTTMRISNFQEDNETNPLHANKRHR